MTFANLVLADGGAAAAWSPWLAAIAALVVATARRARVRRDRVAQRGDLLPDDHARLLGAGLLLLLAGHAAVGLRRRQQPRPAGPRRQPRPRPGRRSTTRRSALRCSSSSACATSSRTPFGLALQGLRDEPARMRALGFDVTLHRMLAFGLAAFVAAIAGRPVGLVQPPHLAGFDQPGADDRRPDHRGHRRPVPARGRVGRRARLRAARQLLARVDARRSATCSGPSASTRSSASSSW